MSQLGGDDMAVVGEGCGPAPGAAEANVRVIVVDVRVVTVVVVLPPPGDGRCPRCEETERRCEEHRMDAAVSREALRQASEMIRCPDCQRTRADRRWD
jgi:hypothetical protein